MFFAGDQATCNSTEQDPAPGSEATKQKANPERLRSEEAKGDPDMLLPSSRPSSLSLRTVRLRCWLYCGGRWLLLGSIILYMQGWFQADPKLPILLALPAAC